MLIHLPLMLCSLESLLGVLYSGFCGAILFGKVLRIQSHAQVIFSDPIVIRYGTGVAEGGDFDNGRDSDDGEDSTDGKPKHHPCPVLEFRIVNRLFNEAGGEIMDATLNVVANVDANDADPSLIDALDSDRKRYNYSVNSGDMVSNLSHAETNSESDGISDNGMASRGGESAGGSHGADSNGRFQSSMSNITFPKFLDPFHSLMGKMDHQAVDEDPSARLVSKRIFSKMLIEASDHRKYKQNVWCVQQCNCPHS